MIAWSPDDTPSDAQISATHNGSSPQVFPPVVITFTLGQDLSQYGLEHP